MKLYSGPLSLFTAKVRIALAEKNVPYELVSVPFSRKSGYSPKHPEVLRINPKAQVPVLVDDDLELYDSTLILEYLEEKYPEPALYPRDMKERARCRQAEAAADELFFPHVYALILEVFYKPDPATRDEEKIAAARAGIRKIYGELDGSLAERQHLFDTFSVADIGYFLVTTFASSLGAPPPEECANVGRWYGGLAQRPSVATELSGMMSAAA